MPILFSIFTHNLNSQTVIIGDTSVCVGSIIEYELQNPAPGVVYYWEINSLNASYSFNSTMATIQWQEPGEFEITVTDSTNYYYQTIYVYYLTPPLLFTDTEVGCQESLRREYETNYIILDPDSGCVNVCENSIVTYWITNTSDWLGNQGSFNWEVSGGVIISADGNAILPPVNSLYGSVNSGGFMEIEVQWGSIGMGNLQVVENSPDTLCQSVVKEWCTYIIESPEAMFLFSPIDSLNLDQCYDVCLDQLINFIDLSIGSNASQIIAWHWDFGDGSPVSHLQNPSHSYALNGSYDVVLTVTNECNCTDKIKRKVCVDKLPPPQIECIGAVCEGDIAVYHSSDLCNPYVWDLIGGNILDQVDNMVTVEWIHGMDGFGYIALDPYSCNDVCPYIYHRKVPIVEQLPVIQGPDTICIGESYFYQLPAWPATDFYWSITSSPSGGSANINSLNFNAYSIELQGYTPGVFLLKCSFENTLLHSCQGTASKEVVILPVPTIDAPSKLCLGDDLSVELLNITNPPSSTSWTIVKPDSTMITVQFTGLNAVLSGIHFQAPGHYQIHASNPASFCDPDIHLLKVFELPPTPISLTGENEVCLSYPYFYSVENAYSGTNTYWEAMGGNIQGTPYGSDATVIWTSMGTKTIYAYHNWIQLPECLSEPLIDTIQSIVLMDSIVGLSVICEDNTYSYELQFNNVDYETYQWQILNPGSQVASISAGQGTNQCELTSLHLGAPNSFTLECIVTKCGLTETFSMDIDINPSPVIDTVVVNPNPICSNDTFELVATVSGINPLEYYWDLGDGQPVITTIDSVFQATISNNTDSSMIFTASLSLLNPCNNSITTPYVFLIEVLPLPNASLSPIGIFNFCDTIGMEEVFVSNSPGNQYTYQWFFEDFPSIIGPQQIQNLPNNQTSYTITYQAPDVLIPINPHDGLYWCVVTDTITGCYSVTSKKRVWEQCPDTASGTCICLDTCAIDSIVLVSTGCGKARATSWVQGSNIVGFTWTITNGPSFPPQYTTSGAQSVNQSYEYLFDKPGIYEIELVVWFENVIPNDPPCSKSERATVIVPYTDKIHWNLHCSENQTGYDLTFCNNSAIFPTINATSHWICISAAYYSNNTCDTIPAVPGNAYDVIMLITAPGEFACISGFNATVPQLPQAEYQIITTYLGNDTINKSCDNREVHFINLSTPSNTIVSNVWNFKDNSISHMVNPIKTFHSGGYFDPSLTVTDKYGCIDSVKYDLWIYMNDLHHEDYLSYDLPSQEVCLFDSVMPIYPDFTGLNLPFTYQWYQETQLLPGETNEMLSGLVPQGAYWVHISDTNYCYRNINPTPAKVIRHMPPMALIQGPSQSCQGDYVLLSGITGAPVATNYGYLWTHSYGAMVDSFTTQNLFLTSLDTGLNTFLFMVYDSLSGCMNETSHELYVFPLPSAPDIQLSVVNCNDYHIQLEATSSVVNPVYTWSNGLSDSIISVFHGGAYKVWLRDENGCKSSSTIEIPHAPDYYFWRFPHGCYSFCEDELPRRINGPEYVEFDAWYWYVDSNVVNLNWGIPGSGINSACNPLFIDVPPNGEGPGAYYWGLDNGLCEQTSLLMHWNTEPCCEQLIDRAQLFCFLPNEYEFLLEVELSVCPEAYFNLYITTPTGGSISYTNLSLTLLTAGNNQIHGYLSLPTYVPYLDFTIEVLCEEVCIGRIDAEVPICDWSKDSQLTDWEDDLPAKGYAGENHLNLYPNPGEAHIFIDYKLSAISESTSETREIYVFDAMGRRLLTIPITRENGIIELDVQFFPAGLYIISLPLSDGSRLSKRLIISK